MDTKTKYIVVARQNDKGIFMRSPQGKMLFPDRTNKIEINPYDIVEATIINDKDKYAFVTCEPVKTDLLPESLHIICKRMGYVLDVYEKQDCIIYTTCEYHGFRSAIVINGKYQEIDLEYCIKFPENLRDFGYKRLHLPDHELINVYCTNTEPVDITKPKILEKIVRLLGNRYDFTLPVDIKLIDNKMLYCSSMFHNFAIGIRDEKTFVCDDDISLIRNVTDIRDMIRKLFLDNHVSLRSYYRLPEYVNAEQQTIKLREASTFRFDIDDSDWDYYQQLVNRIKKNVTAKTISRYRDLFSKEEVLGLA